MMRNSTVDNKVVSSIRLSTIVTFVMQTKPWLREVDLWMSFVNVELDFLQGLDPEWLD